MSSPAPTPQESKGWRWAMDAAWTFISLGSVTVWLRAHSVQPLLTDLLREWLTKSNMDAEATDSAEVKEGAAPPACH